MPQVCRHIDGKLLVQVHEQPDVFLARIPCPDAVSGFTNCYVIQDQEERLFVDAGQHRPETIGTWNRILGQLDRPARGRQSLFITHLHADHAGLVPILAGHHMPIYVPRENYYDYLQKRDPRYFTMLNARREAEGVPAKDIAEMGIYGGSYYSALPEDLNVHLVNEGHTITVGRYAFRVLDTSGHTIGHAALYQPQTGLLFSGDHVLFLVTPVLEAHATRLDMLTKYLNSLNKVAALDVKALYHSHGPLRDDFSERIAALDDKQRRRANEALSVVRARPGATGFEVISDMRWNLYGRTWEDTGVAMRLCIVETGLVMLDHLVATNQAACELRDGCWRYFPR